MGDAGRDLGLSHCHGFLSLYGSSYMTKMRGHLCVFELKTLFGLPNLGPLHKPTLYISRTFTGIWVMQIVSLTAIARSQLNLAWPLVCLFDSVKAELLFREMHQYSKMLTLTLENTIRAVQLRPVLWFLFSIRKVPLRHPRSKHVSSESRQNSLCLVFFITVSEQADYNSAYFTHFLGFVCGRVHLYACLRGQRANAPLFFASQRSLKCCFW